MDKKAALIATAIMAGIALVCVLVYLACNYAWGRAILAALCVCGLWGGLYWAFKD